MIEPGNLIEIGGREFAVLVTNVPGPATLATNHGISQKLILEATDVTRERRGAWTFSDGEVRTWELSR